MLMSSVPSASSVPSFVPRGLDPVTTKELADIWAQVQVRVLELAGGDKAKVQQQLGINGVLSQLDQAQKSDKESSAKYPTIKNTFNRTLQLLQTVGSIAAGAASQVFGPSDLCFNALNFVIVAWQGYQGIYDELAKLLDQCTNFLGRLEEYTKGGMDAKLTKVACQHLQLFVEICDRAVKMRHSKRKKVLVFTKVLFLQDNSVQGLLEDMASLVDKERGLVAAQTFTFASRAAVNSEQNLALTQSIVDTIAGDKADQRKEKDVQSRTKTILRTLAFDESKMIRGKDEPDPFWQRIFHNYLGKKVIGTGDWIFSHPKYIAWERGQPNSAPILAIEGGEESGKSYLAATIIQHLKQKKDNGGSGTRISTAYYFLEGDSREELKQATNLENVAKSVVWQFGQSDMSYLKSAATICESRGEISPRNISEHLIFGNADIAKMDVEFYIIIDGLGDTVGEGMITFLQRASRNVPHRNIRVLLTGDSRCFKQLANKENISFNSISISTNNRSDVEKYIEWRMDKIPALTDLTRPRIPELRDTIRDKLCQQTKGDYFKITTTLDHISKLEYMTEIHEALNGAGKERSQQIRGELDDMNSKLSEKDISEVNEIILWIIFCKKRLSPREMAAALYVKSREPSLLPIAKKFEIKYTLFEIDQSNRINFKSSEIEQFIPVRGIIAHGKETQDDSKTILPAEVSMIKHFLHNVCPKEIYEKFDFEDYLATKLKRKHGSIYRDDPHTGEAKMALACLRVLTGDHDAKRVRLIPYARENLLNHLSSVDLALVDMECKSKVGKLLVKLFTDTRSLDTLLRNDDLIYYPRPRWEIRRDWLYHDDGVDIILKWLGDSAVISDIPDGETRKWIINITSKHDEHDDLLKPAAERMAKIFLREPHFQSLTRDAFLFILGFINKLESRRGLSQRECPDLTFIPAVEQIGLVEKWCEKVLGQESKDSLWEVQIGTVLEGYGFATLAESRARRALELDPLDWRASNLLADVVGHDEGIEILQPVAERIGSDTEWKEDSFKRMAFAKLLFTLGRLYWQTGQVDLAAQEFATAFRTDFRHYNRALTVLTFYYEGGRWSDIIGVLEIIQQQSTETMQGLANLVIEFADLDRLHNIILRTTSQTKRFDILKTMYEQATKILLEQQDHTKIFFLRYYYATALYERQDQRPKAVALWELTLKEDIPQLAIPMAIPMLVGKLGPVYLRKARNAGQDSETVATYLSKLETLLPEEVSETEALLPPKIYLARYHHIKGNRKEAKRITRSIVKLALEILKDDDDQNDVMGYVKLLSVFIPLGDDANTLATLAIMSTDGNQRSFLGCDGRCGDQWPYAAEMWWCRDCINLKLDAKCYQSLQKDTLPFKVCDKTHDLLHLPDRTSGLKDIPEGFVPLGGGIISLANWLTEIQRRYVDLED